MDTNTTTTTATPTTVSVIPPISASSFLNTDSSLTPNSISSFTPTTSSTSFSTIPFFFFTFSGLSLTLLSSLLNKRKPIHVPDPPMACAVKALGISTGLTVSIAGATVFGWAYCMGLSNLKDVQLKLKALAKRGFES